MLRGRTMLCALRAGFGLLLAGSFVPAPIVFAEQPDPLGAVGRHLLPVPVADPRDPLVLDLLGAGIKLSSVTQSSAHFDFTVFDFATKTGSVTQGEGSLVLDGNPSAPINVNALVDPASGDGFADLAAALDGDGNGVIDASYPAFARPHELSRDTSSVFPNHCWGRLRIWS